MTGTKLSKYTTTVISTHILTRRMTLLWCICCGSMVFQLTSSRGGWPSFMNTPNPFQNFNSHPHEEDDGSTSFSYPTLIISTHILTRRMTMKVENHYTFMIFQLTSSRGGWHHSYAQKFFHIYFNSHPHEEDDDSDNQYITLPNISTHILTRRMTRGWIR